MSDEAHDLWLLREYIRRGWWDKASRLADQMLDRWLAGLYR